MEVLGPAPALEGTLADLLDWAGELETQLLLGGRLAYLKEGTAEGLLALHAEVERMLDALIRSLKAKVSSKP